MRAENSIRFSTSSSEMLSITTVTRSLGKLIDQLKSQVLQKVIVLKNNEAEAVILPINEYLILKDMADRAELISINHTIKERTATNKAETISKNDMFAKLDKVRPI